MRGQALKPISGISTRVLKIAPSIFPSPSSDSQFSPKTEFAKAEDGNNNMSCGRIYEDQFQMNNEMHSTDELKVIETQRRALLLRSELPAWRMLLCWTGTCLNHITSDAMVWGSLLVYLTVRVYANSIDYVPNYIQALSEDNNIDILGGFLSFFLVLFVNQTNTRFFQMYGFSKACAGRIQDVTSLAKTLFPPILADRLVRHMNAAHIVGYVGLNAIGHGAPYNKSNFFDVYNNQYKLLSPEEMKLLSHLDMEKGGGLFMKELVTWCQLDVTQARKEGHIDRYQEIQMNEIILSFRASMDGIYDFTDQPPHFFYIHFLVLLSAIYLPLFAIDTAIAAGWGDEKYIGLDVLNLIIVFLQCIFVVGLRALGVNMVDPYGDDLEDLSVMNYVEGTLEICGIIMNSKQLDYGVSG